MFDIQTKTELKRGNPAAFKKVFRLLYPRLKGYCKLFIRDDDQVEDIIQETFISLWDKRKSIKTDKPVESLIFVMLRNRCLNYLKNQKMEQENIDVEQLNVNQLQYLYQIDFTNREEKSLEEMLIDSFRQAVDELPEKMKLVYKKCKIEGQKQKQVAEELGISLKMVEKHIAKAKLQIREKLLKQYPVLVTVIFFLLE